MTAPGDSAPERYDDGPSPASTGAWARPDVDPSASGTRGSWQRGAPERAATPPALASTMLEADLAPRRPGLALGRRSAAVLGLCGGLAVAASAPGRPLAWVLAAGLVAAGLLGVVSVDYDRRARALAWVSGLVAAAALGLRIAHGWEAIEATLLVGAVTVLATAMLHRAQHRASPAARRLALAGLALACGWLLSPSGLSRVLVVEDTVAGWTPALLRVAFLVLASLGTLVFMRPTTTGGTERWWPMLPAWLAVFELAGHLLAGRGVGLALGSGVALVVGVTLLTIAASHRLAERACRLRALEASGQHERPPGSDLARAA